MGFGWWAIWSVHGAVMVVNGAMQLGGSGCSVGWGGRFFLVDLLF